MRKTRAPKAHELQIFDHDTMTYRTVQLYRTTFSMRGNSPTYVVEHYANGDHDAIDVANRLYGNKGAFGLAISTERAQRPYAAPL